MGWGCFPAYLCDNLGMDNQLLIRRYHQELSRVKEWLFYFLMVWTAVILGLAWVDFFTQRFQMPEVAVGSYIILLAVYISHKEVGRWTGVESTIRPGELTVYVWWGTLLLMILVNFFLPRFEVPIPLRQISFEILAAFLASEVSKSVNAYKRVISRPRSYGFANTSARVPAVTESRPRSIRRAIVASLGILSKARKTK